MTDYWWRRPLTHEMKQPQYMLPIQVWSYPPYPPYPPVITTSSTSISAFQKPVDYRRRRRASYCHGGRR